MAVRIYPLAPTDVQPYDQGGKIRRSRRMRPRPPGAVTEYVPAPASDAAEGLLGAKMRNATRIRAVVGRRRRWQQSAGRSTRCPNITGSRAHGGRPQRRRWGATTVRSEFLDRSELGAPGRLA